MSTATKPLRLSPSKLNLFRECPRCFWLDKVRRIERPRGIYPSLPNGMDRVIKTYFDGLRSARALPKELEGNLPKGVTLYPDQEQLDRWRNWRTGLEYQDQDGSMLFGAVDDVLVAGTRHIPFDYKTKGSVTSEEDAIKYYQNQLDCYALLLQENGLPVADYGVLLYYSPKQVNGSGAVAFENQCLKIPIDVERARQVFRDAVAIVRGPLPPTNDCKFCAWFEELTDGLASLRRHH